jgi:NADP-dependent 3-hydroxy acid dehydrogenase YdfG
VAMAVSEYGRLDVLISNAGVMPISPLADLRIDDWDLMVDVNIKGILHGIAAALPVFTRQQSGHFVNMASTAAYLTLANQAVYSGTKYAVRAISEGLRKEVGDKIRVTIISPGYTATNFTDTVRNEEVARQLAQSRDRFAMAPDIIARAIAYALEQPSDVDVNEIVVRSTAQP